MTASAPARPIPTVDGQLSTLVQLNRDADRQLASVRRQIMELQSHELTLITSIESRRVRCDLLLDERLRAVAQEEG